MKKITLIIPMLLYFALDCWGIRPVRYPAMVGNGVNGTVYELYSDNVNGRLYVGGNFSTADDSIPTANIAYVTEAGGIHTWHSLGSGVNGPVYAITEFNNNIWVAGAFSMAGSVPVNNVAYWDGVNWHDAGCTYGVVKDLVVFDSVLYASGDFDVCAAMADVNFAEWDGTSWTQHFGLTGRVNTMEVMDTTLLLGGWFSYNNVQVNAIKWNKNTGFDTFTNAIKNEVNDFEVYKGGVYGVCSRILPASTELLLQLSANSWDTVHIPWPIHTQNDSVQLNTLCVYADSFMVGGLFDALLTFDSAYYNQADITSLVSTAVQNESYFWVDSTINKMVVFKNRLYAGGAFTYGDDNPGYRVNHIACMVKLTLGVSEPSFNEVSIFPNPATNYLQICAGNEKFTDVYITDITGRVVKRFGHSSDQLDISDLQVNVLYILNMRGDNTIYTCKFGKR